MCVLTGISDEACIRCDLKFKHVWKMCTGTITNLPLTPWWGGLEGYTSYNTNYEA